MKSKMLLTLALVAFIAAVFTGYWGVRMSQSPASLDETGPAASQSVTPSQPTVSESVSPDSASSSSADRGSRESSVSEDSGDKTAVVVLARNKSAYSTITEADLILERMQLTPPGSFGDMAAVVGQKLWRDMPAGTILSESSFTSGGPLAQMIREDERALAIAVNEVVSSGGYLRPGDFVDVLLYLPQDDKNRDRTMQVVVPALRVLSVGSTLGATLEGEPAEPPVVEEEGGSRRSTTARSDNARTAVLAIPSAILTRFALAAEVGQLHLAVRSADEELMRRYLDGEPRDYDDIDQQLYQFEKFSLRQADSSQPGVLPPAPPGVQVFRGSNVSREQP